MVAALFPPQVAAQNMRRLRMICTGGLRALAGDMIQIAQRLIDLFCRAGNVYGMATSRRLV